MGENTRTIVIDKRLVPRMWSANWLEKGPKHRKVKKAPEGISLKTNSKYPINMKLC